MRQIYYGTSAIIVLSLLFLINNQALSQQFSSDNYLSKTKGTATIIVTYGEQSAMFITTFSLLRNWEFTGSATLFNNDNDPKTNDGYSMSLYAKYMFYENKTKTGGFAVKFGTGLQPGFASESSNRTNEAFKSYWMNAPVTFGFFGYKLSWDLMPGTSVTVNYGAENPNAWKFTYATRLAWYPFNPEFSIVGEVYGSAGKTAPITEYRTGLRWEPTQYSVFAFTYDNQFGNDRKGGGVELGMMLFTPPFFAIGGIDKKK
jgi:hypothetical protein